MRSVADAEKLAKKSTLTAEQVIQRAKMQAGFADRKWEHVGRDQWQELRGEPRVHYAKFYRIQQFVHSEHIGVWPLHFDSVSYSCVLLRFIPVRPYDGEERL
jgi:hypothetical protein